MLLHEQNIKSYKLILLILSNFSTINEIAFIAQSFLIRANLISIEMSGQTIGDNPIVRTVVAIDSLIAVNGIPLVVLKVLMKYIFVQMIDFSRDEIDVSLSSDVCERIVTERRTVKTCAHQIQLQPISSGLFHLELSMLLDKFIFNFMQKIHGNLTKIKNSYFSDILPRMHNQECA